MSDTSDVLSAVEAESVAAEAALRVAADVFVAAMMDAWRVWVAFQAREAVQAESSVFVAMSAEEKVRFKREVESFVDDFLPNLTAQIRYATVEAYPFASSPLSEVVWEHTEQESSAFHRVLQGYGFRDNVIQEMFWWHENGQEMTSGPSGHPHDDEAERAYDAALLRLEDAESAAEKVDSEHTAAAALAEWDSL